MDRILPGRTWLRGARVGELKKRLTFTGSAISTVEDKMCYINKRFMVLYLLFVGLPLLVLMDVFKYGRTLSAPISVSGAWKLEIGVQPPSTFPCENLISFIQKDFISISQSGKTLALRLNNSPNLVASGLIEGNLITASFLPSANSPEDLHCGDNASLVLTASLNGKALAEVLTGTLSITGCSSCPDVEVRAFRQGRITAK